MEEEIVFHSSILALENPMGRGAWQATGYGVAKSWTRLSTHAKSFLDKILSLRNSGLEISTLLAVGNNPVLFTAPSELLAQYLAFRRYSISEWRMNSQYKHVLRAFCILDCRV